jgi:hypothetical protein
VSYANIYSNKKSGAKARKKDTVMHVIWQNISNPKVTFWAERGAT